MRRLWLAIILATLCSACQNPTRLMRDSAAESSGTISATTNVTELVF
jgi:hypothetical protein